jgi:hypothetical protein
MSGDNRRQAQRIESMRKYRAQSLLAQPQSPGRPHEMNARFYRPGVHLPPP